MEAVSPVNITSAALITQISILIIMFVGAFILYIGETVIPSYRKYTNFSVLAWIILAYTLITFFFLIFSDEFSKLYKPLFGSVDIPLFNWSKAILFVFVCNIICITLLVAITGGSKYSSFSPLFFILPALAIFLRESISRIVLYTLFVSVAFSLTLVGSSEGDNGRESISYWVVSILSLILVTYIGYITRIK